MSFAIDTFRANLAKAIRDHTPLTVGGGEFSGDELATIHAALMPSTVLDWILEHAVYGIDKRQRPVLTLPMVAPDHIHVLPVAIYGLLQRPNAQAERPARETQEKP